MDNPNHRVFFEGVLDDLKREMNDQFVAALLSELHDAGEDASELIADYHKRQTTVNDLVTLYLMPFSQGNMYADPIDILAFLEGIFIYFDENNDARKAAADLKVRFQQHYELTADSLALADPGYGKVNRLTGFSRQVQNDMCHDVFKQRMMVVENGRLQEEAEKEINQLPPKRPATVSIRLSDEKSENIFRKTVHSFNSKLAAGDPLKYQLNPGENYEVYSKERVSNNPLFSAILFNNIRAAEKTKNPVETWRRQQSGFGL